ncbi:DMT family transporter [Tistrella mobilis]|uniref:DMT family transporter n=1 Tax=Tistrella mobilis TaxID=171437 RepID=UPI0035582BE2
MAAGRSMTLREWGLLVLLSIPWGGSFFFIGVAVKELPPFTIVAARVLLAALALHVVLRLRGLSMPRSPQVWAAFFGMGLLNSLIPFSLIVWGQTQIASGLAAILNATTPLFGVLVAHLATSDEKASPNRIAGVLAGFAGVAAMIGPAALNGLGGNVAGQLAILGAAFSYALAGVFGRRFARLGVAPMATATGQMTTAAMMLVPLALIVDQPWTLPAPGWGTVAAILAIAFISTAFAYVLFFRLLATAGATNLMLVTFLVPVSAILLGTAFLGERLEPKHLVGMAMIAVGLALIDGRLPGLLRGALRRRPGRAPVRRP